MAVRNGVCCIPPLSRRWCIQQTELLGFWTMEKVRKPNNSVFHLCFGDSVMYSVFFQLCIGGIFMKCITFQVGSVGSILVYTQFQVCIGASVMDNDMF
jgi:hypothetical protein